MLATVAWYISPQGLCPCLRWVRHESGRCVERQGVGLIGHSILFDLCNYISCSLNLKRPDFRRDMLRIHTVISLLEARTKYPQHIDISYSHPSAYSRIITSLAHSSQALIHIQSFFRWLVSRHDLCAVVGQRHAEQRKGPDARVCARVDLRRKGELVVGEVQVAVGGDGHLYVYC